MDKADAPKLNVKIKAILVECINETAMDDKAKAIAELEHVGEQEAEMCTMFNLMYAKIEAQVRKELAAPNA